MKKKVIIIITVLTLALGVIVLIPTLAWLTDLGSDKSQAISISNFSYSLIGGCDIRSSYTDPLNANKYVAPGENMIYIESTPGVWVPGTLSVLNKSTIATNLRVRIEYTYVTGGVPAQVVYSPTQNADFTVDFAVPSDWQYDAVTECWNYMPGGSNIAAVDLVANPSGITTVLINSMGYSSLLGPGNAYEDKTVTVKFKVEAKQAEYATWQQVTA